MSILLCQKPCKPIVGILFSIIIAFFAHILRIFLLRDQINYITYLPFFNQPLGIIFSGSPHKAHFMTFPGLGRKATPKKYLLVIISIVIKKLT